MFMICTTLKILGHVVKLQAYFQAYICLHSRNENKIAIWKANTQSASFYLENCLR